MRKFAFLLCLFLVACISASKAQSISFCKSVDKEGHAINASQEFVLGKSGVNVVFLLQLAAAKPASVSYDVYKVDKGKEVFNSTMKQTAVPGKNWLSKEVTLYDAGSYRIYVYDDKDNVLAKSGFTIKAGQN